VKTIHNTGTVWKNDSGIKLEYVRSIGELESDDKNFQFFRPYDVDIDIDGNIYILDTGNCRVQKFDSESDFVLTFGNKGQGPGEFVSPNSMQIINNRIYINDLSNSVINVFDLKGNYLEGIKKKKAPYLFQVLSDNNIAVYYQDLVIDENTGAPKLLNIIDTDRNEIIRFGEPRKYEDLILQTVGNVFHLTADAEDNLYIAFSAQNKIEKYSENGELLFRMDRSLDYEESVEVARKEYENPDGGKFLSLEYNSFSYGIEVDYKNRIWIGTRKRQETPEDKKKRSAGNPIVDIMMIEIFNSEGILLGRIEERIYTDRSKFRIISDRFFIVDTWGEMNIKEYKIIEY
jgi:hypothetical protein